MKYVITNIRLPESLWLELKREAINKRKRLSEIIREKLGYGTLIKTPKKTLKGLWKGAKISDSDIFKAKTSWKGKLDSLQ